MVVAAKPNGIWQTIACLLMASWKNRRGRKLYAGMMIEIPEEGTFMVKTETSPTMRLNELTLQHYRNYETVSLDFPKR